MKTLITLLASFVLSTSAVMAVSVSSSDCGDDDMKPIVTSMVKK